MLWLSDTRMQFWIGENPWFVFVSNSFGITGRSEIWFFLLQLFFKIVSSVLSTPIEVPGLRWRAEIVKRARLPWFLFQKSVTKSIDVTPRGYGLVCTHGMKSGLRKRNAFSYFQFIRAINISHTNYLQWLIVLLSCSQPALLPGSKTIKALEKPFDFRYMCGSKTGQSHNITPQCY
jgi:hypothetical protein